MIVFLYVQSVIHLLFLSKIVAIKPAMQFALRDLCFMCHSFWCCIGNFRPFHTLSPLKFGSTVKMPLGKLTTTLSVYSTLMFPSLSCRKKILEAKTVAGVGFFTFCNCLPGLDLCKIHTENKINLRSRGIFRFISPLVQLIYG